MKAADGGTIKKPIMVLPGGKSQERRASRPLFFFVYMTTRTETHARDRARGSFVMLYFFRHINNETNKNRRGVFGVQGSPCPSESPGTLAAFCGRWYGVLKCAPGENMFERGEQNENDNP
jgi:hypothetical protein